MARRFSYSHTDADLRPSSKAFRIMPPGNSVRSTLHGCSRMVAKPRPTILSDIGFLSSGGSFRIASPRLPSHWLSCSAPPPCLKSCHPTTWFCTTVLCLASNMTSRRIVGYSHRQRRTAPSPRATSSSKEFLMYVGHNSLWGILVLIADIWAIVNIFQSNSSTERKVLWTVLVILLPVLGFIAWLIAGPRTARA
jgi:hypothetical protein